MPRLKPTTPLLPAFLALAALAALVPSAAAQDVHDTSLSEVAIILPSGDERIAVRVGTTDEYRTSVANSSVNRGSMVTFRVTPTHPLALVSVPGPSPLRGGANTFELTVTSFSGVAERTLTLVVHRRDSPRAQQEEVVAVTSPYKPAGLRGGDVFRYLVFTLPRDEATSDNIADYNDRVTNSVRDGHAFLSPFARGFRALISTPTVDARDNTATNRVTFSHPDAPIYWLSGDRVAENTADFYDGTWAAGTPTDASGMTYTSLSIRAWTGSESDGTGAIPNRAGETDVRVGDVFNPAAPLTAGTDSRTARRSIYGLSPRFTVVAPLTALALDPATVELSPAFAPTIADYRVTLRTRADLRVRPTFDPDGGLTVGGEFVDTGELSDPIPYGTSGDSVTTTIIAFLGHAESTYTLTVNYLPANVTTVSGVAVALPSGDEITAVRVEATNEYRASVANGVSAVTPRVTTVDAEATVRVNGAAPAAVNLSTGVNTINLTVTAADGTTTENYTLTVNRRDPVPAAAPTQDIALSSPYKPDGLVGGDTYRLVFVGNEIVNGTEGDIATWNARAMRHAREGHESLHDVAGQFRALLSTPQMNARDNTGTNRVTANHPDSPIYWVNGDKVADNLADFYDGTWDSVNARWHTGDPFQPFTVWTGSRIDGTGRVPFRLGEEKIYVGSPHRTNFQLSALNIAPVAQNTGLIGYYGLSPLIRVVAPLTGLEVEPSDITLSPAFAPNILEYRVNLRSDSVLRVRPTAAGATILVAGETVTSGALSGAITVAAGATRTFHISVTSPGSAAVVYVVTAVSPAATDASLSNLTMSPGTIVPAFDPPAANNLYRASVANTENRITITPTPSRSDATVDVSGEPDPRQPDSSTYRRGLFVGVNIITITVTSGSATRTYRLRVTRRAPVPDPPDALEVLASSPLVPTGLGAGAPFRLLFATAGMRNGVQNDVAVYNTFVQNEAADAINEGADITAFSDQFRALLSTAAVDARDNTATTGVGVPIYWLDGDKVADNYADFYDGSWDSREVRNRNGGTLEAANRRLLTGSTAAGIGSLPFTVGDNSSNAGTVRFGRLDQGAGAELDSSQIGPSNQFSLYALSPVLTVVVPDTSLSGLSLAGDPKPIVTPTFASATTSYAARVAHDVDRITVTPTLSSLTHASITTIRIGATHNGEVTLAPTTVASGAGASVPLNEGVNVISVTASVTDNETTFATTYTVGVRRVAPPPPPPLVREVPADSPLAPPGLGIGAQFRMLFVTANRRNNVRDSNIATYNSYVRSAASRASGIAAPIAEFSSQFSALVSSATMDMRDNTATTGDGVPIYWLGDSKVANNYADLYDGRWESHNPRDEAGAEFTVGDSRRIVTGSTATGFGFPNQTVGSFNVRLGRLDGRGLGGEINFESGNRNGRYHLYALSPIFTVVAAGPRAPVVGTPIPDQTAPARAVFTYAFPSTTFYDLNMDALSYTVTGLPSWLTFQPAEVAAASRPRTLRGTPPTSAVAQSPFPLTVTAGDGDPATADVSDTFLLTITPGAPAAPANVRAVAGDRRITVSWDAVTDTGGYPVQGYRVFFERPDPANPGQVILTAQDVPDPTAAMPALVFTGVTNDVAYGNIRVLVRTGPAPDDIRFTATTALGPGYVVIPTAATFDPAAFVTTWDVSAGHVLNIPTNGAYTYAYTVDWGDGIPDATTYTGNASHTYTQAGIYHVAISGDFPHLNYAGSNLTPLCRIKQWGDIQWRSMDRSLSSCANLIIESNAGAPDLSQVTDLSQLFNDLTGFNSPIGHWDVSNVTNMSTMFQNASAFNQDLSGWDVSNVTNMSTMFWGAEAFNQDVSGWDVGEVTDFSWMFRLALSFNQPLNAWDVGSATNMRGMFSSPGIFNQPLGSWDVSQVTNMGDMFSGAVNFNQNLGAWDVGNVTSMRSMLSNTPLSTANYDALLAGWSTVEDGETALRNAVNFGSSGSNYCNAIARQRLLDAPNNWTITDGGRAANCPPTPGAFVTTWDVTANQTVTFSTNGAYTYNYAVDWGDGDADIGQTGHAVHTYTDAGTYRIAISGTFPHLGPGNGVCRINQWGDIQWRSLAGTLTSCDATLVIEGSAGAPDLSNVTDLSRLFLGVQNFNSPIGHWDVSNVTNMSQMFQNAFAFNQDLSNWDVSQVTNFSGMFNGARAFNQPLDGWNIGSATDDFITMSSMFSTARVFDQPLGSWDVGQVTAMNNMFNGVTLSPANYDALLAGWGTVDVESGETALQREVNFNAGNSQYCNQAARNVLTNEPNLWMLTDGGQHSGGDCTLLLATGDIGHQTYTAGAAVTLVFPIASGGAMPLTHSLTPLPDGLTIRPPSAASPAAVLLGAPAAVMPATAVTYTVTDAAAATATASRAFTITVLPAVAFDTTTIPAPAATYTYTAAAAISLTLPPATNSGRAPLAYTLSPADAIPPGLTFAPSTRTLSGMPTEATLPMALIYAVTDANLGVAALTFTVDVVATPTLNNPIGDRVYTVGQPVDLTLPEPDGGLAPLSYTLSRIGPGTSIPPGLIFDPVARTLRGVPSEAFGPAILRYVGTDANGAVAARNFTLQVFAALTFPGSAAIADQTYTVGVPIPFLTLPTATDGAAPLTYTLTPAASLPPGVIFDPATRVLSGAPNTANMAVALTYTITDANGATATLGFRVDVIEPPAFDTSAIPAPDETYEYLFNQPITPLLLPPVTGGAGPLTYALNGRIPVGLAFDADARTLSGTPTVAVDGTPLTYTVTDRASPPNRPALTFTVDVKNAAVIWTGGHFVEIAANDGAVMGELVAELIGDTFTSTVCTGRRLTFAFRPGHTLRCTRNSPTRVTFTWAGRANSHADAQDSSGPSFFIGFTPGAFATRSRDEIANFTFHDVTIDFNDPYPLVVASTIQDQTYATYNTVAVTLPAATGGLAPLRYALQPDTLPAGLTFIPATRVLTGTPTETAETNAFIYTVTDSDSPRATEIIAFTITVTAGTRPDNIAAAGVVTITDADTVVPGSTLTADPTGITDANGIPTAADTFTYQWQLGPADGTDTDAAYTDLPGATANEFTVLATHAGRRLRVQVSFTDTHGYDETITSDATDAASAVADNVAATGAPTLTGTAQAGMTFTATAAAITDANGVPTAAAAFAWQWQQGPDTGDNNNYTDLPGATAATLFLTESQVDRRIRVVVSFLDNAGYDETVTSDASDAVIASATPNSAATGVPTITGLLSVGGRLDVDTSASALADLNGLGAIQVQWQQGPTTGGNGPYADVSGATLDSLPLTADQFGRRMRVVASFTDDDGYHERRISAPTNPVAAAVPPGFVFTPAAVTVTEGAAATYHVALTTPPTANVLVAVISDVPSVITAAPVILTFTPDTWNIAQPVTITAHQDADAITTTAALTHTASGGYTVSASLPVTITDDDAMLTLTPSALNVTENAAATYTIALAAMPSGTVTVTIAGDVPDVITPTPTALTFTAADWSNPQPVTVIAADDADSTDDVATLTHTAAGGDYNATATLAVTVLDDDVARVSLTDATLTEADGTATLNVGLNVDVTGGFRVDVSSTDGTATAGADYTALAVQTLTFAGTAGETQPFTLTLIDDAVGENTETLFLSLDNLQGAAIAIALPPTAIVTITDDDVTPLLFDTATHALPDAAYTYFRGVDIPTLTLPPGTGGIPPLAYTLTRTNGAPVLPPGMTFDDDARTISGTPGVLFGGTPGASLVWTVTDSALPTPVTITQPFTVFVRPVPLTFASAIADQLFAVGEAIPALTLPTATGGNAPLTYTLTGDLPDGLTYTGGSDATGGVLTGAPIAAVTAVPLTYTVSDVTTIPKRAALTFMVSTSARPTVTSVAAVAGVPDNIYAAGEDVTIAIQFSEPVTVTGAPQLALNTGNSDDSVTAVAGYVSGSDTALTFSYTVRDGDNVVALAYTGIDALTLNGGAIDNVAGTLAAGLTLPTVGSPTSLSGNPVTVTLDTAAPAFTLASDDTTRAQVDAATVADTTTTIHDAEATDNGRAPDTGITYTLTGADATTFTLAPANGVLTPAATLAADTTYTVDITATDEAGNAATQYLAIVVGDRPTVNIRSNVGLTNTAAIADGALTFTVTFNETVMDFDTDDITVTGGDTVAFTGADPGMVYTQVVTPTVDTNAGTIIVTVPANVATGTITGNFNITATAEQAYDTQAPARPTIANVTADNVISLVERNNSVGVTGVISADTAAVTLSADTAAATTFTATATVAAATTTWTYTLLPADIDALGEGDVTLTAIAADAVGNTAVSVGRVITVDITPPDVTSVTYYVTEADAVAGTDAITGVVIDNPLYFVVEFNEQVENRYTFIDLANFRNSVQARPRIGISAPSPVSPGNPDGLSESFLPLLDPASVSEQDACRPVSAPPTNRYLCVVDLRSTVYRPGALNVIIQPNQVSDFVGNAQPERFFSSDTLAVLADTTPPSVASVAHYPSFAAAQAGSGPISAEWDTQDPIYSVIQFAGPAIDSTSGEPPAARPQIFHELDSAAREQFGVVFGTSLGGNPPRAGLCGRVQSETSAADQTYICSHAPRTGDTGVYTIIVGTGTRTRSTDIALVEEWNSDTGITLGVPAALRMADVRVGEADGTADVSVTLAGAVPGGFSVDVSTADDSATAEEDYTAVTNHTLAFAGIDGERRTFSVIILPDDTAEGTETLNVSLSNLQGTTATVTLDTATITIVALFGTTTIDNVAYTVGETVALTLPPAMRGATPYTYALTRPAGGQILPNGLAFNATARTISGAPTVAFSPVTLRYTATDADGNNESIDFSLRVSTDIGLSAVPDQNFTVGTAVNLTLPAPTAGVAPYTYTLGQQRNFGQSFPKGLTFDPTATPPTLSGTPLQSTDVLMFYNATDAAGNTATRKFRVRVSALIQLPTPPDQNFTAGTSVNVTLPEATGGTAPYIYTLLRDGAGLVQGSSRPLVAGLTFYADERPPAIRGIPTGTRMATSPGVVYSATDANGFVEEVRFVSAVQAAQVSIANVAVAEGEDAVMNIRLHSVVPGGFTVDVSTADGSATAGQDYTAVTDHTLTFAGTSGEIQSVTIPTTDDTVLESNETVRVSLSNLQGTAVAIDLGAATVTIIDDALFGGAVIADQTYTIHDAVNVTLPPAVGGVAPYTYALTRTDGTPVLPSGLIFDPVARTISGAPATVFGPVTLRYTGTDTTPVTAPLIFRLSVLARPTVDISDTIATTATIADGALTFTFTFIEEVMGFAADDISVTGGDPGAFSGADPGTVYTLVVTPTPNTNAGTIIVTVAADAATTTAVPGRTNIETTAMQTYDTQAPTEPTIDDPVADDNIINAAERTNRVTVTGSAGVIGSDTSDVTLCADVATNSTCPDDRSFIATVDAATTTWRYTLIPADITAIGEGTFTLTAIAADAVGNTAVSDTHAITVDTTTPAFARPSTADTRVRVAVGIGATIIHDAMATDISGTPDTGITYALTGADAATFLLDTDRGVLTPAATLATVATYSVDITATDAVGNAATQYLTIVVVDRATVTITDTIIGDINTPDIAGIADGALTFTFSFIEAVTGFDPGDITVTNDVTVTGGAAGPLVEVAPGLTYTLTVTPLADTNDGAITITVPADTATGIMTGLTNLETTVTQAYDTQAPTMPTIADVTDDNIINAAEQTIGVAVTGTTGVIGSDTSTVTLCAVPASVTAAPSDANPCGVDTMFTADTTDTATTWSYSLTTANITALSGGVLTFEGDVTLTAIAADAAGNTAVSASQAIIVDTVAPTAPFINVVSMDDTIGVADGINIPIIGTTAADTTVTVCFGSSNNACRPAIILENPTSWFYLALTADLTALGQGDSILRATATDTAGNPSPVGTRAITVDTVPPARPTIATVALDGRINAEEQVNGVTLSGTTEDETTVTLCFGAAGTAVTACPVDATGAATANGTAWEYTLVDANYAAIGEGANILRAIATDNVGNLSPVATLDIIVDTILPVFTLASEDTDRAQVSAATGADTTMTFHDANATDNGRDADTGITYGLAGADAATFTIDLDRGLLAPSATLATAATTYSVDITATDEAGNAATQYLTIVVADRPIVTITDTIAGDINTPDIAGIADGALTFTFSFSEEVTGFDPGDITVTNDVTVTGGAAAPLVEVAAGTYTLTVTPTADTNAGAITVTVPADTVTGTTTGNTNPAATVTQAYDTQAPTMPTIHDVTDDNIINAAERAAGVDVTGITGVIGSDTSSDTSRVTLCAGATTATDPTCAGGTPFTVDTTDAATTWRYTLTSDNLSGLTDGALTFTAIAADAAGNTAVSESHTFTVDTTVPVFSFASTSTATARTQVSVDTGIPSGTEVHDADATDNGGDADADITYTLGGGAVISASFSLAADTGILTTKRILSTLAMFPVNITATDAAGNAATQYLNIFAVERPTVRITNDAAGATANIADGPLTFTFTFTEVVDDFETGDITVTGGGSKGTFTGTGTVYTLGVTPLAGINDGVLTITVAADAATGEATRATNIETTATQPYDTQAPTAPSLDTPIATNDIINAAEQAIGVAVTGTTGVIGSDTSRVTPLRRRHRHQPHLRRRHAVHRRHHRRRHDLELHPDRPRHRRPRRRHLHPDRHRRRRRRQHDGLGKPRHHRGHRGAGRSDH